VNAGETIIIPLPDTSYDSHLWMVLSDPTQGDECVLVNFTSWRADKDQACIVEPGEHPYVSRRTCVNFRDAKRCKTAALDELVASKNLRRSAPLSPELLARIRNAVSQSRMNWDCVQLLIDQGLVAVE
jgi:hypothetical protein